jgi:hypothetical protein
MVQKAQANGLVIGLIEHICSTWCCYSADDTIICLKNEMNGVRNLKLLLFLYEMIGGEEHQRVCRTCLMPIVITL